MTSTPIVSVIMVAWNSEAYLPKSISCISNQTLKMLEVILIDNSSNRESLDDLETSLEKIQLIVKRLKFNQGFAVANNIGANLAHGKWIALLNTDAFPEPDWLEKLIQAAEQNPDYIAFSSKQIQYRRPDLLDGAGDAYHASGLAWRDAYNLPLDQYGLDQKEVFSVCAAAALYSREEFLKAGGFDEDYFSYFEDVDLGFRLRLSGAKCLYVPEAVVHHVGSASTSKRSDFSVYYGYRNMIWTFIKNMPSPFFWIFLPLHITSLLFFAVYLTFRGQGKPIWKAIFDAMKDLPKIVAKRKVIQKSIKIKPKDLLKVMSTGLFEPLQEFLIRNRGV